MNQPYPGPTTVSQFAYMSNNKSCTTSILQVPTPSFFVYACQPSRLSIGFRLTRHTRSRRQYRDLAAQQAQAAANFREAIRHSIAVDNGDDDSSTTSSGASPLEIGMVETPPCLTQEVKADEKSPVGMSHNPPQPSSDLTTEDGEESGRGQGGPHMYHADNREKGKEDRKKPDQPPTIHEDQLQGAWDFCQGDKTGDARKRSRSRDNDAAERGDLKQRTPIKRTSASADTCDTTTSGAAHVLASDLSRLASRQSEVASEVLQEPSSEDARGPLPADPRTFHRKFPKVLEALAVLGPSVGLQAKAVGLMEEVVERTGHSRVRSTETKATWGHFVRLCKPVGCHSCLSLDCIDWQQVRVSLMPII